MAKKIDLEYSYSEPPVRWHNESGIDVTFDTNELSKDMQARLLAYGLHHLLRDRTSGTSDPAEKVAAAEAIFGMLREDNWRVVRASGGSARPRTTLLAEAIARIVGCDVADAVAKLADKDKETIAAIRRNPDVKATMAQIKAEREAARAASGEDTGVNVAELFE